MNCVNLTYIEILNEVDLAQIFLWFQEKSILGEGSLVYNKCPGVDFRTCDLIRNHVLSVHMYKPLQAQDMIYR